MDRHTGRLRVRDAPSWWFKSLLWSITSGFPLANHFHFSGSKSVFGLSQYLPMCAWYLLAKKNPSDEAHGEVNTTDNEVTVPPPL